MKVYAVMFIYEGYDEMEYVDKVFDSMEGAKAYVKSVEGTIPVNNSRYSIDEWEVMKTVGGLNNE